MRTSILLVLLFPALAWPCSQPQRLAKLVGEKPQLMRLLLGHSGHNRQRIRYRLSGPQPCQNGMADEFPCSKVDLLGHLALADIGGDSGDSGSDVWGWQDPQTGREYALMGLSDSTAFVDISDPAAPRYLGSLPSQAGSETWRDIKTYNSYALIVADYAGAHGLQVFDLTRLRTVTSPQTFDADAVYSEFERAHNIVVNQASGYAYAVGGETCAGGPHMIDMRDPLRPRFAGCFADDGYTHDAQCVIYQGPDRDYRGREVCFASNEDSVTLIDVSDKNAPTMISRSSYDNAAYTHQGWLSDDQRYFLVDDEGDEYQYSSNTATYVWDMRDLDAPRLVGRHLAGTVSTDHNLYVVGDYVYQANYTVGLRILKLDDLATARLTDVAHFDSYPNNNAANSYDGAWSIYPFFSSGVVVIGDINRGVFLVRPRLSESPSITEPVYRDGFETP